MTVLSTSVAHEEWTRLSPAAALAVTARVVNSSLRLDDVLHTVVRLTCQVLDADRATILLFDQQQRLVPAASDGRVYDPEGLARFREMPPIGVAAIPHAIDVLSRPQVVAIPDVAESPFVPAEWRDAFGLRSLLLAPIVTHDETLGAIIVDYAAQRDGFADSEVLTLEGIAACTSTALRNARLYDDLLRRAAKLDESLQVTAQLNAATTVRAVCDVALDGLLRVLDGTAASVHIFDGDDLVTLATRGSHHPEPGTYRLTARERADDKQWVGGPIGAADDLRHLPPFRDLAFDAPTVLLPLTDPPPPGFVLVTCAEEPSAEMWRVAQSVAGQVMLALDRARLTEQTQRRLEHLETSYRLADELAGAGDLDAVVAQLAVPVRLATGCEVIDIFLSPARGSARFTGRPPGEQLHQLMRAWRTSPPDRPVEHEGLLVVPMLLEAELVGVLRLRAGASRVGPSEEGFLLAAAGGVAGLVSRADLSGQVGAAQRALAVVQERERIARDLHDTLGQSLFGLGLQLAECEGADDPETLRAGIRQARATTDAAALELRQAIHALAFLRKGRTTLSGSLRALAREMPARLNVRVSSSGRAVTVPPQKAEALVRVAREGLVNADKHARATEVAVCLRYDRERVELVIADNGTGIAQRAASASAGLHFGLRTMQRRLEEVGGALSFQNVKPHGLRLTATVPV
jgi:signal transduction histidine kinase